MRFRIPALALLFFAGLTWFGCSSADHPTAPSGTTLTITASTTKIGLNGSARISVTGFRPDGNRLPEGSLIRFTASLGTINPAVTTIGADGYARATFQADGRAGTASITANLSTGTSSGGGGGGDDGSGDGEGGGGGSGAGTGSESASVSIEVSTEQPTLLINANPTVLQILEPSTITVTARDENSLPLGAGEEILLTANLGTLVQDGVEITSVLTESDGRATFTFQAGTQAGTGGVGAILRNSEEATITLDIRDAAGNFTFQANPTTIGDEDSDVVLTATVVNSDGVALPGVLVRFSSSQGGTFAPSSSVTTNDRGIATSTVSYLGSELTPGQTFQVRATVNIGGEDSTMSETITVQGGGA